jgi:hypothetical protein
MYKKALMKHMESRLEDMRKYYSLTPAWIEGYEEALDHISDYLEVEREDH